MKHVRYFFMVKEFHFKRITIEDYVIEGILPKGPYLPCVSMAGGALLAGYPGYMLAYVMSLAVIQTNCDPFFGT